MSEVAILTEAYVTDSGITRGTSLCPFVMGYIKIQRHDGKPMSWTEVWQVFSDRYPGRWACQMFPPAKQLVDDANIHHLFVWPEGIEPFNCNVNRNNI